MIVHVSLTVEVSDPEAFRAAFRSSPWFDRMGIAGEADDLPVEDLVQYLADEATRVALADDLGSGDVIDSGVELAGA